MRNQDKTMEKIIALCKGRGELEWTLQDYR